MAQYEHRTTGLNMPAEQTQCVAAIIAEKDQALEAFTHTQKCRKTNLVKLNK